MRNTPRLFTDEIKLMSSEKLLRSQTVAKRTAILNRFLAQKSNADFAKVLLGAMEMNLEAVARVDAEMANRAIDRILSNGAY